MTDLRTKIQNIQYKGTPVFGRDSNPQNTSEFVALAGTVLFWLIVFLFFIFARPFAKKPEYKTVQIVLSSTPVAKNDKRESAASSAAAQKAQSTEKKTEANQIKQVTENVAASKPKVEPKPAQKTETKKITETQKKSADKPAAKTQTKPAETKQTSPAKTPAPAAPVEYAKSVEDLMAEQMSTPKKTVSDFNWDDFSDSSDDTPFAAQPARVEQASTTGGTSGKAAQKDSGATSVQSNNEGVVDTVGAETSNALKGIASVKPGSAGQFSTNVADTDGKGAAVTSSEGFGHSGRYLVNSEPINISDKNAQTITSDLTFEITFKIQPAGTVSKSDIEFESKANIILTDAVCDEIKSIISRWTFSRANNVSVAKFSLTIKRR